MTCRAGEGGGVIDATEGRRNRFLCTFRTGENRMRPYTYMKEDVKWGNHTYFLNNVEAINHNAKSRKFLQF
jgi:hypothetical protein